MTKPTQFDLEALESGVDDQGAGEDCTAEAFHAQIGIIMARAGIDFRPSRLFSYWTSAQVGHSSQDGGRQIEWLYQAADPNHWGICPEALWPFDPAKVTMRPSDEAFTAAAALRVLRYESCGIATDLAMSQIDDAVLAGSPVTLSMTVTDAFFNLGPNDVYLGTTDPAATGRWGHEICVTGFDSARGAKRIKNSWGTGWGDAGYFWLSDEVIKRDCNATRMVRALTGVALIPGWADPPHSRPRSYLDASDLSYNLTNSFESVHGAGNSQVSLIGATNNVLLDAAVKTLVMAYDLYALSFLQVGNAVIIYHNGMLLAQWPVRQDGNILIANGISSAITLSADGMKIGAAIVSSITPISIG